MVRGNWHSALKLESQKYAGCTLSLKCVQPAVFLAGDCNCFMFVLVHCSKKPGCSTNWMDVTNPLKFQDLFTLNNCVAVFEGTKLYSLLSTLYVDVVWVSVGQLNSTNPVVSLLLCLANGSGLSVFSFMVVLPKGALPLWKCLVLDGSVHNIPEFVLTRWSWFLECYIHTFSLD